MIKKLAMMCVCVFAFSLVQAEVLVKTTETTIGGHFKYLFNDSIGGTRTYRTTAAGDNVSATSGGISGAYVNWIVLFFNQKINDWLSAEFSPALETTSGATPKYGTNLGTVIKPKSTASNALGLNNDDFTVAKINAQLPDDYSLSIGQMYSKFTWDYGNQLAWEDQIHISKFSCTAAGLHNTGFELQKSYDIFGLPVPFTFEVGNGNGQLYAPDKNQNLSFMVRAEPELFGIKWGLGYYNSRQPDSTTDLSSNQPDTRYSLGAEYASGPIYMRSEIIRTFLEKGRNVQDASMTTNYYTAAATKYADLVSKGGYNFVTHYAVAPGIRLEAAYYLYYTNEGVKYSGSGSSALAGPVVFNPNDAMERDEDFYYGIIFNVADGASILVTYECGNWTRQDNQTPTQRSSETTKIYPYENLSFNRFLIGTRITF